MRQALAVVVLSFVVSWLWLRGARDSRSRSVASFKSTPTPSVEQYQTSVAGDSAGDFVVVWTSNEEDGDRLRCLRPTLRLLRFVAWAAQFQVNSYTTYHQYRTLRPPWTPTATSSSPGRASSQDGRAYGIFARRFDSSGTAQGVELQVNTYTTTSQNLSGGGDGRRRRLRRRLGEQRSGWRRSGRLRPTLRLEPAWGWAASSRSTPTPPTYQERPAVAMDADGDFVVVWQSVQQDGSDRGSSGSASLLRVQLSAPSSRSTASPPTPSGTASVAIDGDGDFVVAWTSYYQDGSRTGVFAQRFDSSGTALGVEFRVNSHTLARQQAPLGEHGRRR